jgi:hypothetical protein
VTFVIAAGAYGLAPAKDTPAWLPILGLGLIAMIAAVSTLSDFYNRVVLYPDAIEYRTVWSTSWLPFTAIRGRRDYVKPGKWGGPRLRVVSTSEELPMLDFSRDYNFDDTFWAWFKSLPDLDRGSQ